MSANVVLHINIETDKTTYNLSETVNWTLGVRTEVTAGESMLGIAGLSIFLDESQAEVLSPGTIDAAWNADYPIRDGGTVSGVDPSMLEKIEVLTNIFGPTGAIGTPSPGFTTLATGAYTATVLGSHTLSTSTPVPADQGYFTTLISGTLGGITSFANADINNGSVDFTVVPEPGATKLFMVVVLATMLGACVHRRSKRVTAAAGHH
jgi:hypothetical protein